MNRYVPKTYYNRRIARMIIKIVLSVALAAVILFVALFFWIKERYGQYYPDGTFKLEIPAIMDESTEE